MVRENESLETQPENAPGSSSTKLTRRETVRRYILLAILLVLLALLAYAAYYYAQNRRLPTFDLGQPVAAIQPPQYLFSITGTGVNELQNPVGVGVSESGRVYVVDFRKRRISVFTTNGRFLFSFNKTDGDVLRNPVHLVVKGEEVWVTDRRQRTIYVYDLDGNFVREFDGGSDISWTPLALAFSPAGELRVTDVGNTDQQRLLFFDEQGERVAMVGRTFQALRLDDTPGGFFFPNGLAVSQDGNVYVSDGNNRRVQVFDSTGEFQSFIDTSGIPRGIAIDAEERLYVADAVAHTIDVYDLKGARLTQFGSRGFGPGQFNYPNDIALDKGGRIYITDRENHQVQVWGWPVAGLPPVPVPASPLGWLACLSPLLLLPLLLLLRKIRYIVTPDFVEAMIDAEMTEAMSRKRRLRLVAPEQDRPLYAGRVVGEIQLDHLLEFAPYSESDARVFEERYELDERAAMLISMASRVRGLATEDRELRRNAVVADVRATDFEDFKRDYLDE